MHRFHRIFVLGCVALVCLVLPKGGAFAQRQDSEAAPGGWRVMERSEKQVPAFVVGSWDNLIAGKMSFQDFKMLSPPDMGAGLGLATVYGPAEAGWFLHAGRRLHVKTPGGAIYSYESLAKLGWAVGVARDNTKSYGARINYGGGSGSALGLEDLVRRAVAEAPDASAWIVAGQADFDAVRAQWLGRSPVRSEPEAGDVQGVGKTRGNGGAGGLKTVTGQKAGPGLLVALVVKGTDPSALARSIRSKCFGNEAAEAAGKDVLVRAHYAIFQAPAPAMNPAVSFQSIWKTAGSKGVPPVSDVGAALAGTRIRRANLLVWSIGSLEAYNLYKEPDFVDVAMLDPTILTDQRFATKANPFGVALYPKPRFVLRAPVAKAILRVNEKLRAQGFRLKLYDAYRPLAVTQRLWHMYQGLEVSADSDRRYLAAPNVGSRHNRGAAVDCTMTDMDGNPVEMPSDYLVFDERANLDSKTMTPRARAHLAILTKVMLSEGFTTIRDEWWHFDAAGYLNYRVADVPFWPRAGEEDKIADRTKDVLAETGEPASATEPTRRMSDELPELPAQNATAQEMPESNMDLPSLPDSNKETSSVAQEIKVAPATAPPSIPEGNGSSTNERKARKSRLMEYVQKKTEKVQGLPLLLGSIGGITALGGIALVLMLRPGRGSGRKKR